MKLFLIRFKQRTSEYDNVLYPNRVIAVWADTENEANTIFMEAYNVDYYEIEETLEALGIPKILR